MASQISFFFINVHIIFSLFIQTIKVFQELILLMSFMFLMYFLSHQILTILYNRAIHHHNITFLKCFLLTFLNNLIVYDYQLLLIETFIKIDNF